MAKEKRRIAPRDELTDLPLTIFYDSSHSDLSTNFQHGWHSKARLKEKLPNSWARALRISRGYVIPIPFHMAGSPTGYHTAIDEGPKPPASIDGVYSAIGLAVSRVVPRMSIDLVTEPGRYKLKSVNNKQHEFLSRKIRTGYEGEGRKNEDYYRRRSMGEFAVEYSLIKRQESHDLTPAEDELIQNPLLDVSENLGAAAYKLFVESIKELSDPLEAKYKAARQEGMISGSIVSPTEVILSLAPEHQFHTLFDVARQNINGTGSEALQTGVNAVELAA